MMKPAKLDTLEKELAHEENPKPVQVPSYIIYGILT